VERLGYSVAGVLLALLVGGLGLTALLPWLGVSRPLDPGPVVLLGDVLTAALLVLRRRRPEPPRLLDQVARLTATEARLLGAAGACVVGAVLGAVRLNNGAGNALGLVTLTGVVATFAALLATRNRIREGAGAGALYLVSLALLLMTSLRGWLVTGHDIQHEYRVFQLTLANGRWDMQFLRDAYNACLSITVLPTELVHVLQVGSPIVFKVFFQLVFAVCPVLVYAVARRYWSRGVALLSAAYFVGFPTFLNDLPFLTRQQVAFLFVCVAVLAATHRTWSTRVRQAVVVAAGIGVELAHYSTMYVLVGTLLIAWLADRSGALVTRVRRGFGRPVGDQGWADTSRTLGGGVLAVLSAFTLVWGGLVTHTGGAALDVAASAVSGLTGRSSAAHSSVVSYSLFGGLTGQSEPPQQALDEYRQRSLAARQGAAAADYLPLSVADRYPTTAIEDPQPLPLTAVGRVVQGVGIDVEGFNTAVRRLLAAKGEQVFVAVGLIGILLARRRRRGVGREFALLCLGSIGMVALTTVMPNLSVDYGVLRAFQEALIVLGPVLVAGSLTVLRPLGERWAPRAAAGLCLGIFVSTSGLLPQSLGGYPAQLALNNSGTYYDVYYAHPEEAEALTWLRYRPGLLPAGLQASYLPERFISMTPADLLGTQVVSDIYPTRMRTDTWVLLGYSTVRSGRSSVFANGDVVSYTYPKAFLEQTKSRVFSNGGAEIYR
jgi:hypothetical protein